MEVKICYLENFGGLKIEYATDFSSGIDLVAAVSEEIILKPLDRVLIPTGISLEIPVGYEGQVRSRSGLAIKHGIFTLNSPGTIDADYRGEIKIILANFSNSEFIIKRGQRLAQIVFAKFEKVLLKEVGFLNETVRSDGGFGHTGI